MKWSMKHKLSSLVEATSCGIPSNLLKTKKNQMKKTKKAVLITSLLMAASVFFTAQKVNAQGSYGEIRGRVWEDSTKAFGQPGANVFIKVGGEILGAATDVDGRFVIKPVSPGSYNLTVTFIGKDTIMKPITVNPNMASFENDLVMTEGGITIGTGVVITSYREKLINPEETSVKSISYKDLKNNPNLRSPKKLLQTMTTDIVVSENGKDAYVRGGRSDATIYFVDGVKMSTIGNVPGAAIGSMTVYTGGVPAKYGDTTSGVVILETKSYFDLYNEWLYSQGK